MSMDEKIHELGLKSLLLSLNSIEDRLIIFKVSCFKVEEEDLEKILKQFTDSMHKSF